ncbi:DUF2382 domain-containing protein [Streptomyces sp. NPDC127036]|uniref:DUF2382 domain-containing protein n=1 Tax=Streptomyces sp. NPDC127036 TaxID=3347112 RepID=UPI00365A0CAA
MRHEEVRVVREPVTDADMDDALSGPEITEAEHEVTLHAERPVVETRVQPVERVRWRPTRSSRRRPSPERFARSASRPTRTTTRTIAGPEAPGAEEAARGPNPIWIRTPGRCACPS